MKLFYQKEHIVEGGKYRSEVITMSLLGRFQNSQANISNDYFSIEEIVAKIQDQVNIEGFEAYIFADATILNHEVFEGLRLRTFIDEAGIERVKKFADWNEGGFQPIRISNDGSKVILRTNIGGSTITNEEIILLSKIPSIELLGPKEFYEKMATPEFYT